jgi:hypothetical protein
MCSNMHSLEKSYFKIITDKHLLQEKLKLNGNYLEQAEPFL